MYQQILDKLFGMQLQVLTVVLVCTVIFVILRFKKTRQIFSGIADGKMSLKAVALAVMWIIANAGLEELISRLPLILVFDRVDATAWLGIIYSSFLFALMHGPRHKSLAEEFTSSKNSELPLQGRTVFSNIARIVGFVIAGAAGALFGYLGITTQNLIVSWTAHVLWNVLFVFVFPIVFVSLASVLTWIISIIPERKHGC
ncbi:MAG: hypothetical protein UU51_C0029G0006 [Microgenomates group bacterium GW2011_GWC1_41_20]|uniref:CAAX prenyl protease 2/Lysostaphin resistance protein A-like domain-containing protein n=3 Tax=Katanobacteria TaxID=422282 RepID=A0A0G0YRW9_UNCKA|nr:MAG: hypothetical protein UU51_C0029G0006 [Microgenomates group bacterium GW2011_GWC1_41_20]KKS33692.1 MAG: hypothetical protein UU97_C0023G0009 [candidate division WWE3 bacterium GW2011_GWD1_42_14]KKS39354.1 MAG: hypothetical protein UV00_C0002G0006 [candidate division WWE3 bacterium GW2011_GWF1_42_14]KKS40818.1 MAG: hypothetical protein UV03_C0002G0006 [candidate division WWE3 bacterium GW2011_GWE1_42_16]KKS66136.1 MAG: hypothetical protein UV35_C0025G0006 [candidate division WWE3 bacteriu